MGHGVTVSAKGEIVLDTAGHVAPVGRGEILEGEGFKIENLDGVSGGGRVLGREGACGEEAEECSSGKVHGSLPMVWRIGIARGRMPM